MIRPLAAIALLALPVVASAQDGAPLPSGSSAIIGPPILGGRVVIGPPITNGASALFLVETPIPPRFSVGGGSMSAPPQVWVPSGQWSVVSYPWPVVPIIVEPAPVPPRVPANRRRNGDAPQSVAIQPVVSGEASATLVVQFPAAAEIWVGGKKADGDPAAEWTLASPALVLGESHTFEVKGRWKVGGKTFEASRSVAVTAGDRGRSIVVSGIESK